MKAGALSDQELAAIQARAHAAGGPLAHDVADLLAEIALLRSYGLYDVTIEAPEWESLEYAVVAVSADQAVKRVSDFVGAQRRALNAELPPKQRMPETIRLTGVTQAETGDLLEYHHFYG